MTGRAPEARLYLDANEIVVDSFAGGGGASQGIAMALGRGPDIAINHDAEAIALHRANHPEAEHYTEDVWHVDPIEATRGRPVGLMWLSPDCKHFSKAKGGKPVSPRVRGLAWVAVRWAKAVKPRIIVLENVEEFQGWGPIDKATMRPDPRRAGHSFRRFCGRLRGLGYEVEHRELRGCDYGAPTIRKRLFLIARRDGQPIVWPTPTHGKGRALPWRTAGECIDFSIPCPSIFLTAAEAKRLKLKVKRPLAANTMRRVAAGIRRFVLDTDRPYVVARGDTRVAPLFVPRYGEDPNRVTRSGHIGQEPRVRSVQLPIPTIVPTGNGASLVAAFLAKHYGDKGQRPGLQPTEPLSTITSTDHHALVTSTLVSLRGTERSHLHGDDIAQPLRTISAGGTHAAEVRAFLISYYGTDQRTGDLNLPIATVTPRERFGLVRVEGQDYEIVDVGMRMLEPRELYRAQGFPDSYRIDIPFTSYYTAKGTLRKKPKTAPLSKGAQVRMCGNSVCPDVAAAIITANTRRQGAKERAA